MSALLPSFAMNECLRRMIVYVIDCMAKQRCFYVVSCNRKAGGRKVARCDEGRCNAGAQQLSLNGGQ
jgi:hypothetical protein